MSNKLKIIVLEDEFERRKWFSKVFSKDDVTFTCTSKRTIQCLEYEKYDLIFLDRDICDLKDSGEKVALEMMKQKIQLNSTIVIHTMNPYGQKIMKNYLDKYHKTVYVIPYTELIKMKRKDFYQS